VKKAITPILIVLLLCLGLTSILAESPLHAAAFSPVAKVSLSPFVHVKNSTVGNLHDGIGYVDATVNINGGVLAGTYTNTTELQDTNPTNRQLVWISVYGSSNITINNTNNMSSTGLFVYGSSRVTIINSTLGGISAYDSSTVNLRNSSAPLELYNNSKAYLTDSNSSVTLAHHSYLSADNLTSNQLLASDFSTFIIKNCTITSFTADMFSVGQIINSTVTDFGSVDAADISVENSTIVNSPAYGLVCTGGSFSINGNTVAGLSSCRNTTTLIDSNHPTPSLISISATAGSSVSITNNSSITQIFAHDSSSIYLENTTGVSLIECTDYSSIVFKNSQNAHLSTISCYEYSSLELENVTWLGTAILYDQSSMVFKNSDIPLSTLGITISMKDQSELDAENISLTDGLNSFEVDSYDSSVVDVVNVTATSGATTEFYAYDLSVMTINSSDITTVGYSVKSNGAMSVTNGLLGGSYIYTTTWINPKSLGTVTLNSIAIVGIHTATIVNTTLYGGVHVYLHDNANLNTQNSTIVYCDLYDSSEFSGTNTTLGYLSAYEWSTVSLFNVSLLWLLKVYDFATLNCSGSASAPSSLNTVESVSNYPQMTNVVINNCTVGTVRGVTWIPKLPVINYLFIIYYFYYLYSSSQNQFFTLSLAVGGGAAAIVAAAVAIALWRRKT